MQMKENRCFYVTLHIKINSVWVTDLNVSIKGIQLLEDNMSEILIILHWVNFLDLTRKVLRTKFKSR